MAGTATPTAGGVGWVLPALVLLVVFVYYPIVDNIRFRSSRGVRSARLPRSSAPTTTGTAATTPSSGGR